MGESLKELMVKYNAIIKEHDGAKLKYASLLNEKYEIIQKHHIARNEIIDKSQKTIDAVNEKHNKLKQRSRRDSLTMIESNNDLEGMRTKNDEYMLKIKRLDTEKANLTQNLSKIKSELKKYESDKMNYTKLQQKFDELLSDKKELSQKIENIKKNNLKEKFVVYGIPIKKRLNGKNNMV